MRRSFTRARCVLPLSGFALVLSSVTASFAQAQATNAFVACTPGALSNCATIQLTSELAAGPGGMNLFRIALGNIGSQAMPSMATTIYNLIFSTSQDPAPAGSEVDALVAPEAIGGASITDASEWDVFDSGDAIFLSALTNNGVGGCVAGGPVGGFGQAGQTCGAGQFFSFSFFTPRAYDPNAFALLDYEVAGLTPDLPGDSCGGEVACVISPVAPVTATPEPGTLVLAVTGVIGIAGCMNRRRRSDSGHAARPA